MSPGCAQVGSALPTRPPPQPGDLDATSGCEGCAGCLPLEKCEGRLILLAETELQIETAEVQKHRLHSFTAAAQVPSLVGELRSCKHRGTAKREKKNRLQYQMPGFQCQLIAYDLCGFGRVLYLSVPQFPHL